jgi:hypothetical protein
MINLSDPTFQFIVIILIAILTLIVAIFAYLRRNKNKSLSFRIINIIPLLNFRKEAKDKIKIFYEGQVVENVTVSLFQFVNTGNAEILESDFQLPISINFKKENRVLMAEVIESKPANLQLSITTNDNVVSLKPDLLNAKDSFTVKILTAKFFNKVNLDYRIVGVPVIKEINPKLTGSNLFISSYFLAMFLIVGGALGYGSIKSDIFLGIVIIGIIIMGIDGVYMTALVMTKIVNYFQERKKIFYLKSQSHQEQ